MASENNSFKIIFIFCFPWLLNCWKYFNYYKAVPRERSKISDSENANSKEKTTR